MEGPTVSSLASMVVWKRMTNGPLKKGKALRSSQNFVLFLCFFFPSLVSNLNFLAALWVQVSQEKNYLTW